MDVRIYQPAKNAMQSGRGNSRQWIVEYEPFEPKRADALMGWIGSGDTRGQLKLKFDSQAEAVAYADRNGLSYHVRTPKLRRSRPKNYADNFRYDKIS